MIAHGNVLALAICKAINHHAVSVGCDLTGEEVLDALEAVRYEITEALIAGSPHEWGPRVIGRGQQRGRPSQDITP